MANYTLATLPSKFAIGDTITFSYTGAVQTFPLLNQKDIKVECYGAQGGTGFGSDTSGMSNITFNGNNGSYLAASLKQNNSLSVYVGGMGGNYSIVFNQSWNMNRAIGGTAGWIDGGTGSESLPGNTASGGGGGSSSVRATGITIMAAGGNSSNTASYPESGSPYNVSGAAGGGSQQYTGGTLISQSTAVRSGNGQVVITILSLNTLFLIQDGSNIKSWNGTSLTDIGSAPVTATMFANSGSSNLSGLTKAIISSLTNPKVLVKRGDNTASNIKITSLPFPKLVLAKNDISLSNVTNKLKFTLNSNTSGSGVLKLIASTDSGTTWKTFDGTNWNTVDITSLSNVKTNGMTPTVFNAISNESWDDLIIKSGSLKVRFGYYLEIASTTDVANTDLLTMTVTASGTWSLATLGTDYSFGYSTNANMDVKLLANGDYRITII